MATLQSTSLYPQYAIHQLGGRMGCRWAEIVHYVSSQTLSDPSLMAFTLTMRRLGRASGCQYSHHTCAACALDVLDTFAGNERELVALYYKHLDEINETVNNMRQQRKARQQAA